VANFNSLVAGFHTVYVTDVTGLVEQAGSCTYPVGGTECTVTHFSITPICDGSTCAVPVNVIHDQVIKVTFKYSGVYEGFGAQTIGGRNGTIYRVTNLNDTGTGSLRDALSQGNRYIVFDVAGEIVLSSSIYVKGANITVDGFTAPPPGITLKRYGLTFRVTNVLPGGQLNNLHDIIVRGLRIEKDGYSAGSTDYHLDVIGFHGYSPSSAVDAPRNIVFDHNSFSGALDENISIGYSVHDITFSWNIISESHYAYLQDSYTNRISVHHNLFTQNCCRNPMVVHRNPDEVGVSPVLSSDIRNNLIGLTQSTGGHSWGTVVSRGAKANIINNYYLGTQGLDGNSAGLDAAIRVCKDFMTLCTGNGDIESIKAGGAYVNGNVAVSAYNPPPTVQLNNEGTTSVPYPAAFVTTADALTAACQIVRSAGVRPANAHDQPMIDEIETELAKFGNCH
jgi:hypothetical protein